MIFQRLKKHHFSPSPLIEKKTTNCRGCCTKLINLNVIINQQPILKNINLHFHCGELTVLVGPNGAGKSTLFKTLLGEIAYQGEICFQKPLGNPIIPKIGYVPQKLDFDLNSPITVRDLFKISLPKISDEEIKNALEKAEVPNLFHKKLGHLSGGEIQRTLMSLALTPLPEILLLDEPISGLDMRGVHLFYKMVSKLRLNYDLSILLVSHDLNAVAPYADRMILLNKEILCDGPPAETLSHPELKKLLGEKEEYVGF